MNRTKINNFSQHFSTSSNVLTTNSVYLYFTFDVPVMKLIVIRGNGRLGLILHVHLACLHQEKNHLDVKKN